MNLYLLERQDDIWYDEFDSIVVAAPSEAAARAIRPRGGWCPDKACEDGEILSCKLLGTCDLPEGIVHTSFVNG